MMLMNYLLIAHSFLLSYISILSYSRGIVFWGGPLESRNVSASDEEANEEVKDNERDELKE